MDVESQLEQFCMHCGHKIVYLAHQAGSNVFCPKCGQSVQIQADASNPVKAEPSQVVATSSDIMPPADVHLSIEGQQYGPYTEAEIQGHLKTGQVAPTTLARGKGMSGWLPLNELLQPALEPAVAQPIATNPQATIATSADPQPEVPVSADIDDEAFKCMECGKAFKYQGSLENHQKRKRHGNYQQLPSTKRDYAIGFLCIVIAIGIWAGLSELYSWVFSPAKNEEVQNEEGGLAIKDIVGTYHSDRDKDPHRMVFLDDGSVTEYNHQNMVAGAGGR